MAQGLPALLAAAAALVPLIGAVCAPAQELEGRYLEQGKNALKAKDYAGALTCYDRLAHLSAERPEVLYGLAVSADALGQSARAEAIMSVLAPPEQPGYARAHYWLARRLLAGSPNDGAEAAKAHLLSALDGELDDRAAADALLGEIYLDGKRYDKAELHLTRAVKAKPALRLRLARLYVLSGDKERARAEGERAVSYFRTRAQADLEDRVARLGWADSEAFLEKFPDAVAVLQEGLQTSDDSLYRTALGAVYLLWSETTARDPEAKPGDQLTLVVTGLRYDPANSGLLNSLLAAIEIGGPKADQARQALEALLASGKASAGAHFALGLDAARRGQTEEARLHFERAVELAPQTPAIANNLAWVLAMSEPTDLPRALQLSNLAVQHAPNDATFHDTRGRILMKLERWQEALGDLETVLPARPDNADLHKALAEVYDRLQLSEMAAKHRRLADKKAAAPPTP